jgi:hypothetical protein
MKAPSKKARVVLAPMSETAARLMHQLIQEAAEAAAPAPGAVVLKPHGTLKHQYDFSSDHRFVAYGDDFVRISWTKHPTTSMPQWLGHEDRYDDQGRRWERTMWGIVDDFGTLVEVPL